MVIVQDDKDIIVKVHASGLCGSYVNLNTRLLYFQAYTGSIRVETTANS